jgi:hypothetical protein
MEDTCESVSELVEGSSSMARAVSPTRLSQLHAPQNELLPMHLASHQLGIRTTPSRPQSTVKTLKK